MSITETEWINLIRQSADEQFNKIRDVRRHLHKHPELSFQEYQTSAFIKSCLSEAGIEFSDGWVKTGILATIHGSKNHKTLALRGDMDALPIAEKNNTEYASVNAGIMHACGHDVHTACLLGAGLILKALKEKLPGNVQLVFQPGEERNPGGASLMLEEGVFGQQVPSAIMAQHVFPSLPAGKVGFKPGRYMASCDEIYIKVRGKGGHAAAPSQLIDPVIVSANILIALQTIASRYAPPFVPTVLSFGKVIADGATNIIPDMVSIDGTFRTMDEQWRMRAHELIHRIVTETAHAFGARVEIEISKGYPVLHNDEELTERCRNAAIEFLGVENVVDLDMRMSSEDFSWFAQEIPGCFYRLGTAGENGAFTSGIHTNTFDIEEEAIRTGMGLMAWLAVKELIRG